MYNELTSPQIRDYLISKGTLLKNEQVFLDEPLHVFKKVYGLTNIKKDPEDYEEIRKKASTLYYSYSWEDKSSRRVQMVTAIANLIIPVGTLVNLPDTNSKKLRAERAFCWSIFSTNKKILGAAVSKYDNNYVYLPYITEISPGWPVTGSGEYNSILGDLSNHYSSQKPTYNKNLSMCHPKYEPFSKRNRECESGIHFFLELNEAINY